MKRMQKQAPTTPRESLSSAMGHIQNAERELPRLYLACSDNNAAEAHMAQVALLRGLRSAQRILLSLEQHLPTKAKVTP
jgi:hypothetical protein